MTIPWLENCAHDGDGWCLACVSKLGAAASELADAVKQIRDWQGTRVGDAMKAVSTGLCGCSSPASEATENDDAKADFNREGA